jgi:hypothetical protein
MSRRLEASSGDDRTTDLSELLQRARRELEDHPYRTLAVAASVGFLLGGGMFGRVARPLVGRGLRLSLAAMAAPLVAQALDQFRAGAERVEA